MNAGRLEARLRAHAGGWVKNGLGVRTEQRQAWTLALLLALSLYTLARQRRHPFWRQQIPWALLLVLTVFCCLPEDRRYYVAVAPLLWVAALGGLWESRRPLARVPWAAPLLMAFTGLPIAWAGHREPPPPVQMFEHLRQLHPPEERERVYLLLGDARRHGHWYAQDFQVHLAKSDVVGRRTFRKATAFYTDRTNLQLQNRLTGCRMEEVAVFTRSSVIYPKHSKVRLYRIWRPEEVPTPGN